MNTPSQTVILILGLPGSGKTTLSRKIADALLLPLLSRDELKLLVMDNVGWRDREWSKKVGKASYDLLDYIMVQQIKTKHSFIIESDFRPEFATDTFQALQHQYGFNCLQIICRARPEVLIARWQNRAQVDPRHPSNTEGTEGIKDLQASIALGERQAMKLKGSVFKIDTSDFAVLDDEAIIQKVRKLLTLA